MIFTDRRHGEGKNETEFRRKWGIYDMKDKLARLSIIDLTIINPMSVSVSKIAADNRYRRHDRRNKKKSDFPNKQ